MHPVIHAEKTPDKAANIMANSGRIETYREFDQRTNRAAQLFYTLGLVRGDHIAFCLENHPEFLVLAWAAQRSGLYFTPISSRLTAGEVEYIIDDCGAKVFTTSGHGKTPWPSSPTLRSTNISKGL
jgi:long-chain acyl-CoA synthetase